MLDQLRVINSRPVDMSKVLHRLGDPKEYKGDATMVGNALEVLNSILSMEGLEVRINGISPSLIERAPAMATQAKPVFVPQEAPNFADLTDDTTLGAILADRWKESQQSVDSQAYVGAIVLMGSLLEGAILSVISSKPREANSAVACPKQDNGKPKEYHDWTLSNMIDVGHECGWLQGDVKRFSHQLRAFRNIIHPWEQRAMGASPDKDTSAICWEVVRAALNDLARVKRKSP